MMLEWRYIKIKYYYYYYYYYYIHTYIHIICYTVISGCGSFCHPKENVCLVVKWYTLFTLYGIVNFTQAP